MKRTSRISDLRNIITEEKNGGEKLLSSQLWVFYIMDI